MKELAERIVNKIWSDINNRCGMDIDVDEEIEEEIRAEWAQIVLDELKQDGIF